MKLRPIKPKKISDQVFDQLRELIFRGDIKPGEQLLPERATEQDILSLAKAIKEMEDGVRNGKLGNEADAAFHMAVTFATKNPVQIHLMRNFYDFLFIGIKKNLSVLYEHPENVDVVLDAHKEVYTAISNSQPDEAEETCASI